MNVLLDSNPEAPRLPREPIKPNARPRQDALSTLTTGVLESYSDFVKRILSAGEDLLAMAERAAAGGGNVDPKDLADLFPEITAFTQRLSFNVLYRGPQKFAWGQIPLSDIKAIRKRCGTSVNDVILAMVTATVRRYCELHGERVKGRLFRMMVPVNLRGSEKTSELGNRISVVPVTIPLSIQQPRRLLAAVHKRTEFLKQMHAAELVSLAGGLIGMFPTSVQALAGPIASQLPVTPFNLVCTNVPGPQFPLYLLGHKLIDWYPYVPVGGEMSVNCAILSYNGTVYFGFSGDVHAAPDLRRMENLLHESFEELMCDVHLRPSQNKKVTRTQQTVPAAARDKKTKRAKTAPVNGSSPVRSKREPESTSTAVPPNTLAPLVVA